MVVSNSRETSAIEAYPEEVLVDSYPERRQRDY